MDKALDYINSISANSNYTVIDLIKDIYKVNDEDDAFNMFSMNEDDQLSNFADSCHLDNDSMLDIIDEYKYELIHNFTVNSIIVNDKYKAAKCTFAIIDDELFEHYITFLWYV